MKNTSFMKKNLLILCLLLSFAVSVNAQKAKYVFYFIGDGMGAGQVLATEMMLAEQDGRIGYEPLCMTNFPIIGMARTYSNKNSITDSAAGGTALSTGYKTTNGFIGMTSDSVAVETIAEKLKKLGFGIAVCTTVSIDHATPACFYAHATSRKMYNVIGNMLPQSGFDFFAGAGFRKPLNQDGTSIYDKVMDAGYTIARGLDQFDKYKTNSDKMLLIQRTDGLEENKYESESSIPYRIDRKDGDLTLEQITRAAIEFTPKENGFFMMLEAGKVDWGCHANDLAAAIGEVQDLDDAVKVAYDFYLQHKDSTLIVITADHETGGLSLGCDGKYFLRLKQLERQKQSGWNFWEDLKKTYKANPKLSWGKVKKMISEKFGLYSEIKPSKEEDKAIKNCFYALTGNKKKIQHTLLDHPKYDMGIVLTQVFDRHAQCAWTTTGHSAANVPVYAIGVGAEQFAGWQDNIEIEPKILKAMGY